MNWLQEDKEIFINKLNYLKNYEVKEFIDKFNLGKENWVKKGKMHELRC